MHVLVKTKVHLVNLMCIWQMCTHFTKFTHWYTYLIISNRVYVWFGVWFTLIYLHKLFQILNSRDRQIFQLCWCLVLYDSMHIFKWISESIITNFVMLTLKWNRAKERKTETHNYAVSVIGCSALIHIRIHIWYVWYIC